MRFTFSNLPAIGWTLPAQRIADLARHCEEVGFERFAVADYRFYHDCFVVMTACLQATSRLEVESLTTDPYVRHPSLTAAAIATMNDLSGGRAILGIGGGVEQPAFWGESRPHPVQALREAVAVCRRLWQGQEVTDEGQVIRTYGAKMNFAVEQMPRVLVAARGKRMLRLAGEIADIVHLASFFVNVGHHRDNLEEVKRGAERAGRSMGSFEVDISMPCSISDDREAARAAARRPAAQGILWTAAAERYSKDRKEWVRPPQFNVPEDVVRALSEQWDFWTQPLLPPHLADLISDDVLDQFALAGTPEECAERLKHFQRELPEVTGLRLYAVPPAGKSLYEGYVDFIDQFARIIQSVNAPAGSGRT